MRHDILVPFRKSVEDRHIVYGEVYAPNAPDSQGDFMAPDQIEKMAHRFLAKGLVDRIDTNHDLEANGSRVVESFIAREGDPDFAEGAWVLGVHIPDETTWNAVKSGDLNAFSMYGAGKRTTATLLIDVPDSGVVKGDTLSDRSGHAHPYLVRFGDNGALLGGKTGEAEGHAHSIKYGTVTEATDGHTHRFDMQG